MNDFVQNYNEQSKAVSDYIEITQKQIKDIQQEMEELRQLEEERENMTFTQRLKFVITGA